MKRIIILLENHSDTIASTAEVSLIKHLHEFGYDALCLEWPNYGNAEQMIETSEQLLQGKINATLIPMLNHLNQSGIKINDNPVDANNLLALDYLELCNLLQATTLYQDVSAMALFLLAMKTQQDKIELIRAYKDSMVIQGINLDVLGQPFDIRENNMFKHIEILFEDGKNSISIIGKNHAEGLVSRMKAKGLFQHAVFLDISSPSIINAPSIMYMPGAINAPFYDTFAIQNQDIIRPILITPTRNLEAHLPYINSLLGIEQTPSHKQKPTI